MKSDEELEELCDLSVRGLDEIIDYLLVQVKEAYNRHETNFEDIVRLFQPDDWEHDDHICEQCSDSVSTTIWNI